MLVGYDIDGVVTKGAKPRKEDVVITGRTIAFYEKTKKLNIDCPIYFNPYRHCKEDAIKWKAEIITKLGIDRFYDDEEYQAQAIREKTNCEVIIWKHSAH